MTTVTATQLKTGIGQILDAVQFHGERVIVTRRGRPAAAIISIADLQVLEELEDQLDAADIERVLADPEAQERIPLEDVLAESRRLP